MHILIVNQHTRNFGDDAAGDALIRILLESVKVDGVDIVHNGAHEEPTVKDSRVKAPSGVSFREIGALALGAYFLSPKRFNLAHRSLPLRKLRSLVKSADVVIVAPSGANIGIYRDWQFLARLLLVAREGANPVFHWNTIGSSGSRLFDRLALSVLRRSRIYVREQASLEYVESRGLHAEVGYDTAFALPPVRGEIRREVVSLIPSELDSWHPAFMDRPINDFILREVCQEIAGFATANQLRVEILPHLQSELEESFNMGVSSALIASGLSESDVIFRRDVKTYTAYDECIATSRVVIGGRYHSAVLAAKNSRPFVALSYENKMREVCRYLELSDLSVDLMEREEVRARLNASLKRAYRDHDAISKRLREVVQNSIADRVRMPARDLGLL